jgi:hypothetical protein
MTQETVETGAAGQGLPFPPFRRPRPWRASRRSLSAGQVGVGQALADDALGRAEEAHAIGHLPIVEPEGLLIQVAEEMERLYADVGSLDRALEERPEVLHAVGVDLPLDVLLGVVDDAVDVFGAEVGVGLEGVSEHLGARLDVLPHLGSHGLLPDVGDDLRLDLAVPVLAVAFQEPHDGHLAHATSAGDLDRALALVHEPGLAADESLVHFDLARHLVERACLDRETDAVGHEPGGLLRDAEIAGDLVGADAVLAVHDEPQGGQPLFQGDRAVLENSPDLGRELLLAALALPQPPGREEGSLGRLAAGAGHGAIRPAQLDHESQAGVGIGEELDGIQQGGGDSVVSVHGGSVAETSRCVKYLAR